MHVVFLEDRQRCQRRRAGERIAGVAVRMQERIELYVVVVERLVDRVGRHDHGQRQVAAGQSFRQAQEIRADAGLLAREHRAGAAEADGDFVGDQVHAVPVAGLAQQLEIHRVVHAHAARALHQRLDDHGGNFVRMARQGCFHGRELAPRVLGPGFSRLALVAVRRGHRDGVHEQRAIDRLVQLHVADRERAKRFAVIAVGQRDEAPLRAAPRLRQ